MIRKQFKLTSLLLAVLLVISIVPFAGLSAFAEEDDKEVILKDGSKWLLDQFKDDNENYYNTFDVDSKGVYTLTTTADCNPNSGFELLQEKSYPALSSVHNLSVDYRDGSHFGFSMESNLYSNTEVIFYRTESANWTEIFMADNNGNNCKVAGFWATRSNLADIGIKKVGTSYYMTYRGNVVNGEGYDDTAKEITKLENYFPADYLDADGSLYFFFGAAAFSSAIPVRYVAPGNGDDYFCTSLFDGDRNNAPGISYFKQASVTKESTDTDDEYTIEAGQDWNETALTVPVGVFKEGQNETEQYGTYMTYSSAAPEFSAQQWHSVIFSNDPYATDDQCDFIWMVRVDGSGSPHIIHDNQTLTQCVNMLFNTATDYGAYYGWKFVKTDDGSVKIQCYLNGNDLQFETVLGKLSANKPIYMKYRSSNALASSPSANVKYKVLIPKTSEGYNEITSLKNLVNTLPDSDTDTARSILNTYAASPLKTSVSYSVKDIISTALNNILSVSAKEVNEMANAASAVIANEQDWFLNREEITPITEAYNKLDNSIKYSYVENKIIIEKMNSYLGALETPDASSIVEIRKCMLGNSSIESNEAIAKYDYKKDGSLNVVDLIRTKKALAD